MRSWWRHNARRNYTKKGEFKCVRQKVLSISNFTYWKFEHYCPGIGKSEKWKTKKLGLDKHVSIALSICRPNFCGITSAVFSNVPWPMNIDERWNKWQSKLLNQLSHITVSFVPADWWASVVCWEYTAVVNSDFVCAKYLRVSISNDIWNGYPFQVNNTYRFPRDLACINNFYRLSYHVN